MKSILIIQVLYAISVSLPDVNGTKVYGPGTNISAILWKTWLKANGLMKNWLPPTHYNDNWRWRLPGADAAVGRRFLKNIIAEIRNSILNNDIESVRKVIQKDDGDDIKLDGQNSQDDTNDVTTDDDGLYSKLLQHFDHGKEFVKSQHDVNSKVFDINDFTDYDEDPAFNKDSIQIKDNVRNVLRTKSASNARNEDREKAQKAAQEKAHSELIQRQHDNRVSVIVDFMQTNKLSTQYLYEEVRRIKKTGVTKDILRQMVEYLEHPGMENLKKSVVQCFLRRRKIDKRQVDIWKNRIPNNLAINIVKDPFSHGFVN